MLPAIKLNKFSKQEIENQAIERLKILDMHKEAHKNQTNYQEGRNKEWPLQEH